MVFSLKSDVEYWIAQRNKQPTYNTFLNIHFFVDYY